MTPRPRIVLATASQVRQNLLRAAGVAFEALPARIDEASLREAFCAEGLAPRDQADALADLKAQRVAARIPDAVVIGCDQVLDLDGVVLGKPADLDAARVQLHSLRFRTHVLFSAVVVYADGAPVWRHLGKASLTMRPFSDAFLDDYLARNADSIKDSVGGYLVEQEGIRLFSQIDGDYFTVLGLPLLPLLSYLGQRGWIET